MDTLREPKKSGHWFVWLGLVAVLVLGFGLAMRQSKGVGKSADDTDRSSAVQRRRDGEPVDAAPDFTGDARPSRGPEDAPVTVVEFTDYQCPFCARHYQLTYPRLFQEYGDRIQYVVRNFPIVQNHPHAAKAAEAAECAFVQGRFWQYHDRLFENSSGLDNESLERYARDLGLDSSRFDRCLDSGDKSAHRGSGSQGRSSVRGQGYTNVLHQRPDPDRRAALSGLQGVHRAGPRGGRGRMTLGRPSRSVANGPVS